MAKRLIHTGSMLRPRPVSFKAAVAAKLYEKVWPLFAARKIAPVIDSTFPLARAADAHARMEASEHIGKIVLTVALTLGTGTGRSARRRVALPPAPPQPVCVGRGEALYRRALPSN